MFALRRVASAARKVSTCGSLAPICALVLCATVLTAPATGLAAQADIEALPSFAEPGISPDGSEVAFVSGGDIWTVSTQGGATSGGALWQ